MVRAGYGAPAESSPAASGGGAGAVERGAESRPEVLAARCPGCSYVYEVEAGDEHEGFAAGTAWADVPDDWCCPDCGVREKVDFVPVSSAPACA